MLLITFFTEKQFFFLITDAQTYRLFKETRVDGFPQKGRGNRKADTARLSLSHPSWPVEMQALALVPQFSVSPWLCPVPKAQQPTR